MKWLKRAGTAILILPVALFIIWGLYEVFGMCVNHLAARKQTGILRMNLENEISDIEIVRTDTETGNTSGTGNHVDCLSSVVFSTEMHETEIAERLAKHYVFDEWNGVVNRTDDGYYIISVNTPAPFEDNIEGH